MSDFNENRRAVLGEVRDVVDATGLDSIFELVSSVNVVPMLPEGKEQEGRRIDAEQEVLFTIGDHDVLFETDLRMALSGENGWPTSAEKAIGRLSSTDIGEHPQMIPALKVISVIGSRAIAGKIMPVNSKELLTRYIDLTVIDDASSNRVLKGMIERSFADGSGIIE